MKHPIVRLAVAVLLVAATAACAAPRRSVAPRPPGIVVVLGFDDGSADQLKVAPLLRAHGVRATFYVNTGRLGTGPYYLTWDQVGALAADGHEIAGHTLTHPDLTTLPPDRQRQEVCGDRDQLVAHGYAPVSFAYPYGHGDPAAADAARDCGYTNARVIGGLASAFACPTGCRERPFVETVPPPDPWGVRAANLGPDELTLDALQKVVTDAAPHGPGVLPLFFHNVCDAPCTGGFGWVTPATFGSFLDWLAGQSGRGVRVLTNREALEQPGRAP